MQQYTDNSVERYVKAQVLSLMVSEAKPLGESLMDLGSVLGMPKWSPIDWTNGETGLRHYSESQAPSNSPTK